uniref:Putative secreted peptide n=1 Tax=Anopheles braziliensis TaxID=58242 RepID=A0A2M3ZNB0_9DIPT
MIRNSGFLHSFPLPLSLSLSTLALYLFFFSLLVGGSSYTGQPLPTITRPRVPEAGFTGIPASVPPVGACECMHLQYFRCIHFQFFVPLMHFYAPKLHILYTHMYLSNVTVLQ